MQHMSPCVCVYVKSSESVARTNPQRESQDGRVCEHKHTPHTLLELSSSSSKVLYFASRLGGELPKSASRLLVHFGVVG